MKRSFFSIRELPSHHAGMLIVKMRDPAEAPPSASGPLMRIAAMAPARVLAAAECLSASDMPGMSLLAQLQKGGLVQRATQLSRHLHLPPAATGPGRAMGAMFASFAAAPNAPIAGRRTASVRRADPHARVTMLALQRGSDAEHLRAALQADPAVESVDPVPMRYLVARKAAKAGGKTRGRNTGKKGGMRPAAAAPRPLTMWNLAKIQWPEARALAGFQEAGAIKVAVLDTGLDDDHPDLDGSVKGYTHDFPDAEAPSGPKDLVGHGTHVAGTMAAVVNNNVGINGICKCALHAWKIFSDEAVFLSFGGGFAYVVDPIMYQQALADCLEQEVDVINLSIGGPGKPDAVERQLFEELMDNGTTIVAAMGNERQGGSPTSYPAAIPGVIAVGATTINDTVADFSNRGNHISISAPGVAIWSTLPTYAGQFGFAAIPGPGGQPIEGARQVRETDYDAWDGTSMASPHVAAAAALLLANKGDMAPSAVRDLLRASADRVPDMNGAPQHPDYGAGRLNLLRLLQ